MIQLSRDLDCQYKTAFVLAHKLREAMAQEVQTGEVLEGHVDIDGAYFGGHVRPENRKEDRKDRRLKEHQTGKRRVVIAMRERVGPTHLHQYANHAAWLEDNRRFDNGELAHCLVANSMSAPVSRNWKGYWQRAA